MDSDIVLAGIHVPELRDLIEQVKTHWTVESVEFSTRSYSFTSLISAWFLILFSKIFSSFTLKSSAADADET
jgi:hypothetical protein